MKTLILELEDEDALLLERMAASINREFDARWTPDTLALSFLVHLLRDDQAANEVGCDCSAYRRH